MARVLLIDKDPALCDEVRQALLPLHAEVFVASTGQSGLASVRQRCPDLVLLGADPPDISAVDVCRGIRAAGALPVVFLSAREDDDEAIAALDAGADWYLVKPVAARVLQSYVAAALRHLGRVRPERAPAERYGALLIDRVAVEVTLGGRRIPLAHSERMLLFALSAAPDRVFSREDLLAVTGGTDGGTNPRNIDSCVKRLRSKLGQSRGAPGFIDTVRGRGYRFRARQDGCL
ncbi:response regulator transcription factor [Streptomyces sp. ISL-12]|uniref:response regulator transcription factor n=1 Tax=Streptomyces sp. ISL-12 TaxID=2819177 RepID=UPI001BEAAED2|nr:response regulator transcription factor [Streptomyces sp. ISL-12]MBT2413298.1 response regulator transcription factor [Streptomyces sp. ISL-12]